MECVARHPRHAPTGSASGPTTLSISMTEPGQPCVMISGKASGCRRAYVDEVDVQVVDLGQELRERVQPSPRTGACRTRRASSHELPASSPAARPASDPRRSPSRASACRRAVVSGRRCPPAGSRHGRAGFCGRAAGRDRGKGHLGLPGDDDAGSTRCSSPVWGCRQSDDWPGDWLVYGVDAGAAELARRCRRSRRCRGRPRPGPRHRPMPMPAPRVGHPTPSPWRPARWRGRRGPARCAESTAVARSRAWSRSSATAASMRAAVASAYSLGAAISRPRNGSRSPTL